MRPGAGCHQNQFIFMYLINEQPIWFDMAFPKIFLITFQSMVFVLGRRADVRPTNVKPCPITPCFCRAFCIRAKSFFIFDVNLRASMSLLHHGSRRLVNGLERTMQVTSQSHIFHCFKQFGIGLPLARILLLWYEDHLHGLAARPIHRRIQADHVVDKNSRTHCLHGILLAISGHLRTRL